ncbi:MAG: diaminopimelate epimerase [Chromatiales bacterium]
MNLQFSKMHGLGNDFVVFDATQAPLDLSREQLRFIADRHFGIGCDQILMVEAPRSEDTEFYYRIFNADGGEVEQCGNGARCFARYVVEKGLTQNRVLHVGTMRENITLYLEDDDQVRVNMGVPSFEPADLPFTAPQRAEFYEIPLTDHNVRFSAVSMGNPHAVFLVDDINATDVERIGPFIGTHELFPKQVNVGFMAIRDRSHIDLRVYERGSGETLACGTGACAAAVTGQQHGWLDQQVLVALRGGELIIDWQGEGHPVWMTGPAEFVFEGTITL